MYVARDVLPLATYTGVPLDNTEGWLLWAKLSLLVVTVIGLPLFIPRKYVPLDPKVLKVCCTCLLILSALESHAYPKS